MVGQSLWETSIREEATGYSGAFIAANMENRSQSENVVCMSCYSQLRQQERLLVTLVLTETCRLCAFQAIKPEAFTKPFCDFLTENPTIFHTVAYAKSKLEAAGYKQVSVLPPHRPPLPTIRRTDQGLHVIATEPRCLGWEARAGRQVLHHPKRQLHHRLRRRQGLQAR